MILKRLGTNVTEVDCGNGTTILFSYQTPVACHIDGQGYYVTDKKWSRTTSKHITQWVGCIPSYLATITKPQAYFDGLMRSMQATNARGVC